MKRQVKNLKTGKIYESIAAAERELGVYDITYNCQEKINYVYVRGGKGKKVYEKWVYVD